MMIKEWFVTALQPWIPSEFLRGAAMALIAVLLLIVFSRIIALIRLLCCGGRRCPEVIVPLSGGKITVSSSAITEAVRNELQGYAQLELRKINLRRHRKEYALEICCAFHSGSGMKGVPELAETIKPQLTEAIKTLFGIQNLSSIDLCVVEYQKDA